MLSRDIIARRVRLIMADKRISQRDLAAASGLSLTVVNRIAQGEWGDKFAMHSLARAAEALGVSLSELLLPQGYAIIDAEGQPAGVVQWLTTPFVADPRCQDVPQPADIGDALHKFMHVRRGKASN